MQSEILTVVVSLAGLLLASPDAGPAPFGEATVVAVEAPPTPRVPAGTIVDVEIVDPLSTRKLKRGDFFAIRLAAPIAFQGRVLVPAGVLGKGQIVDSAPASALGKPAKLLLAARYLEFGDVRVPLRSMMISQAGADHSDAILLATFVPYVGILAAFAHGGEIEIPAGTPAHAKLASDLPVPMGPPLAPDHSTNP